jgi:Holliday junction resolvasome RuvABC endonuclease subunit
MTVAGTIFALDLASRTGYAAGPVGDVPRSGTVILKKPGDPSAVAFGNLIAWLNEQWTRERPALVVTEAPFSLQAFRDHSNAEATVRMTLGLHGIVGGMCHRFGLPLKEFHPATIRKHFLGRGRMGSRAEMKSAVVARCHLLGFMPRDCHDDNRADAIATWDYTAASPASKLYLFGERAVA